MLDPPAVVISGGYVGDMDDTLTGDQPTGPCWLGGQWPI
jgi:hypothetical protein